MILCTTNLLITATIVKKDGMTLIVNMIIIYLNVKSILITGRKI